MDRLKRWDKEAKSDASWLLIMSAFVLLVIVSLLSGGCAASGNYAGATGAGTADDPRVAMLNAARELKWQSQKTLELSWIVVEGDGGTKTYLPNINTYQAMTPPDVSMSLLELSKDPWPGRIYAIGSGIVSAGMAATGVMAVHEIGKMGVAAMKASPSVNNSNVISTKNTGAGSASGSYAPLEQTGDGSFNMLPEPVPAGE